MSAEDDPRKLIPLACRVLERAGQGDMVWGHVSMRDAGGRGVWIKGSELGFDEVTEDDVILLGWDGEILEGQAARHVEYPIHTEIMAARPDVNAVVHTHPIHAIAFAATGWPLLALSHETRHFVPPDIPRFRRTSDVVRSPELGQALSEELGERRAILMPHHGITTTGANVGEAVAAAQQLERACQIALLAGRDAIPASAEDAQQKTERSARRLAATWAYLSRKADRELG